MTITSAGLTRAAAVATMTAGAIYVAVQINHPPMVLASVGTTEWVVRSSAKAVMATLALAGITGLYLRHHRRVGVLGLIGWLLFAMGFLAVLATTLVAATVLPRLVGTDPAYVLDVIVSADGGVPTGDIGAIQTILNLSGIGYIVGGVVFGIALFRSRAVMRWASALLVLGALATAALAVLPEAFNRPTAVPVGIALIGLGISLWREERRRTVTAPIVGAPGAVTPVVEPAGR